jgi:hypothetical protein
MKSRTMQIEPPTIAKPLAVVALLIACGSIAPERPARASGEVNPPVSANTVAGSPSSATDKQPLSPVATRRRLTEARLRILVPAYFYPGGKSLDDWERLIAAATRVPVIAVMNVGSGPGTERNPEYAAVLDRALEHGVTMVGYVFTNYGNRPQLEVEAEIDRWLDYYPRIHGIFFDAQAGPAGREPYYEAVAAYARRKIRDGFVIANPGTTCSATYLDRKMSNVTCVIESADSLKNYHLPLAAGRFTSDRFAALCFGVENTQTMQTYIEKSPGLRLGYIFITDQQLPNPWLGLPRYWDAEVDAVRRVNLRQTVLP